MVEFLVFIRASLANQPSKENQNKKAKQTKKTSKQAIKQASERASEKVIVRMRMMNEGRKMSFKIAQNQICISLEYIYT